jgi:EAL domain-containing protein (putative c-di-GMP-specific phosphodiesterase class I)
VAEGVETEEQLAFLRSHNCDEVQGFYFYKPLQLAEFENILRTNAAGPRQTVNSKVM